MSSQENKQDLSDIHSLLKQISFQMRELLEWYKAVNFETVRESLSKALPTPQKRVAYELTSRERSSREIKTALEKAGLEKVNPSTISAWQNEWIRLGLARQISPYKREKIFNLSDFNIAVGADLSKTVQPSPSTEEENDK